MSKKNHQCCAWIALADTERCRLLRCDLTKQGTHRVREITGFENRWPKHRRGRPMALGGMTGDSYAAPHHYVGERIRRFAEDVIKQLEAECKARQVGRLVILAPARFMGELRQLHEPQHARFELREGELMQFSTAALASHPVIQGLIDRPKAESRDWKPAEARPRLRQ